MVVLLWLDAKQGGLISLKHGGEFSGMVPGDGHGMEDNVYMPITEGPKQVGTLAVSPSEYVVDSYTMSALGYGNTDAGAKVISFDIQFDSEDFSYKLLKEAGVALAPGSSFGPYEKYFRLCFSIEDEKLLTAIQKIGEYLPWK